MLQGTDPSVGPRFGVRLIAGGGRIVGSDNRLWVLPAQGTGGPSPGLLGWAPPFLFLFGKRNGGRGAAPEKLARCGLAFQFRCVYMCVYMCVYVCVYKCISWAAVCILYAHYILCTVYILYVYHSICVLVSSTIYIAQCVDVYVCICVSVHFSVCVAV